MDRTQRLEALMERADKRRKRRRALRLIAINLSRPERAEMWTERFREATALCDTLWAEWLRSRNSGLRLVPHDDKQAFVVEQREG